MSPTRRSEWGTRAIGIAFGLLWLLPLTMTAVVGYPPRALPPKVRDQFSISCLFGQRPRVFDIYGVEVLRQGAGWRPLDLEPLFGLAPFGHRTRFDRFMARFGARNDDARNELAQWIAHRTAELDPSSAPIVAVRFVVWKYSPDDAPIPQGAWDKAEACAAAGQRAVVSTHEIKGEQAP